MQIDDPIAQLHFGIPEITVLILLFIGLALNAAKHGQPTNQIYHFPVRLLTATITLILLYTGGFFDDTIN